MGHIKWTKLNKDNNHDVIPNLFRNLTDLEMLNQVQHDSYGMGLRHIVGGKGKKDNSLLPSIDGKIKYAFTLSETLIALVIIGIIAAITIPAISRSSEKYILRNQFKKTYSTILNAILKSETDLGGNVNCSYPLGGGSPTTERIKDCNAFYEQMFANMSLQKVCKGNAKTNGCIPNPYMKEYVTYSGQPGFHRDNIENNNTVLNLTDGTIVILYGPYLYPLFLVDINGAKGSNTLGKDIFEFFMDKDDNNGFKIRIGYPENELRNKAYFKTLSDVYKE